MSRISVQFIIDTLESVEDEAIERGDRFRPLTIDVGRCLQGLKDTGSLPELDEGDH